MLVSRNKSIPLWRLLENVPSLPPILWPNSPLCQGNSRAPCQVKCQGNRRNHAGTPWQTSAANLSHPRTHLCFLLGTQDHEFLHGGKETRDHSWRLPAATTGEVVAKVVWFTNVYPREGERWLCTSRQKIKTRVKGKKLNVWNLVLESSWRMVG